MRKLRLVLEDLSVDSFPTDAGGRAGGTVVGHAEPLPSDLLCPGTWDKTCQPSDCTFPMTERCWPDYNTEGYNTCQHTCQFTAAPQFCAPPPPV